MTDTTATAAMQPTQIERRSQSALIWKRFKRHKLGLIGLWVTLFIYLCTLFVEILAPQGATAYSTKHAYYPPQRIHFFTENGSFKPHVLGYKVKFDYDTGSRSFIPDPRKVIALGFWVKGDKYKWLGLIPGDRHLFGPIKPREKMFLVGADRLGRDVLSRTIYASRISMTIGLAGVALSLVLGIAIGGLSGYMGGFTDQIIQRFIEFLQSLPSIPLWIGLAAAIPAETPPLETYFLISIVLSVLGWTGLARVVRGRFLALKEEDFIRAATLDGCSTSRILFRHMLPNFTSHIIAVVTLAIPGMILAETALSYLGIGLRAPVVSWGVLLQEIQNIRSMATAPWLFFPGLIVVIAVLALNFLGDGLRDAADPHEH
ncbi:ABC transporter permease [uncultured Cohaesibacter sp.]|uniref:ABC transporter permease n=1 Tax=uncultured Cohaesibacter sp. TaxID=1002546 RepID=UPI002931EE83|nr:ABC transporter permease [uncultured Cohaesibacter sp.]